MTDTNEEKVIIDEKTLLRSVARLSHEIIEQDPDAASLYLVGIKRRGVPLARMIAENIRRFSDIETVLGELDITLYRDDLTETSAQASVNGTSIDFDVAGKTVNDGVFSE